MPDTNPPGLYLRVESEPYQVPCDCNNGWIMYVNSSVPCTKCNPSGHNKESGSRTVRLVGYVPVRHVGMLGSKPRYEMIPPCFKYAEIESVLIDYIIEAWQNNTLPDAIRRCLREVDCDDSPPTE